MCLTPHAPTDRLGLSHGPAVGPISAFAPGQAFRLPGNL